MAILAVFDNAVALAEEIEARTSALQAIKEGRLPLRVEAPTATALSALPEVVPSLVVTAVPVAPVAAVAVPAVPAAPMV